ncbi:MAG: PAS domain-containing sensor histidine kinase [Alphaproteobacteria bacterium]|nr:PAS domain-containing sensor histidine kinase [Alphaproteobacteria bacterium]
MTDISSDLAPEGRPAFAARLRAWASRARLGRKLAFVLTVLAVIAGIVTYLFATAEEGPDPARLVALLTVNLVLLLMLGAVVARELVKLWVQRRQGLAGARLHVRLVALFAVLAGAPAVVMAVASTLFFNLGVQAWFSDPVRNALRESLAAAEAYLDEHRNNIRGDIQAMAADLGREGPLAFMDRNYIQQAVDTQTQLRALTEAIVFDGRGQVLAKSGLTLSLQFEVVPFWALDRARAGEVVIFTPERAEEGGALSDRVRAMTRIDGTDQIYLLVGRYVEPRVVQHVDRTRLAVQTYESIEGRRSGFQVTFAVMFVVVALLLLLAAIWIGLALANRLARPVGALIAASERVRAGELSARVAESDDDDELATLSRAFNGMTGEIESQRRELVEANRQIENRRRFTEAVLGGVSAGVVGLDENGHVAYPNLSASHLIGVDLDARLGQRLGEIVPEFAPLIEQARANPDKPASGEIHIAREGQRRTFSVRVAQARLGDGTLGLVATFDDVTDLEAAQRKAAWSDVARRIAHEIKNPLTPIQLSAERLKRKYLPEIKSDPDTFRLCTDTIVRQVGDIGRMVDEFSAFARMPAPKMAEEDAVDLVRHTAFLQQTARTNIEWVIDLPKEPLRLRLDPRQIGQALTNLLQNAVDAIDGRDGTDLPRGRVEVRLARDEAGRPFVAVGDNGKGLPKENRDRLTEPYVTTRAKGTGLGLAIVKKIMEDHGGAVILADRDGGGAVVTLQFPSDSSRE